jgi:type IV secretion system protein VirB1
MPAELATLLLACAPLVDPVTAQALVAVESGGNPLAIGVVGGELWHQPRSLPQAIATVRRLRAQGWDFSVGLAQINVHNLERLGLALESAFDPCANLRAMQAVLGECYGRAAKRRVGDEQQALRAALSCYYTGNFQSGFDAGYVARVVGAARHTPHEEARSDACGKTRAEHACRISERGAAMHL